MTGSERNNSLVVAIDWLSSERAPMGALSLDDIVALNGNPIT
jgi:hypothetical protein